MSNNDETNINIRITKKHLTMALIAIVATSMIIPYQIFAQDGIAGDTIDPENPIFFQGANTGYTGTTVFVSTWHEQGNVLNDDRADVVPVEGQISHLYGSIKVAPGAGKSFILTLIKNLRDTSLTCTISDTAKACTDALHSVSVASGDRVLLKITPTGSPSNRLVLSSAVFSAP